MSIITTILNKELLRVSDKLNILWTSPDTPSFTNFINELGHNLIFFENLYYGNSIPHLILCNNRISYYEQVKLYSLKLHLPVLIVDHTIKSTIIDIDKSQYVNSISSSYSIALNKDIYNSWNGCQNQILDYTSVNSKEVWNNLLYQIAKKVFLL